jgi:lipoprotein-anchoring transpeptidase ErfK/SrfK
MSFAALRSTFAALAALALFSGCATYPPMKPFIKQIGVIAQSITPPPLAKSDDGFLTGERGSGAPHIVVKLGEQHAYFYRGKTVVASTRISTGKDGFQTPAGSYQVIQKDPHHRSTSYGDFVNGSGAVVRSNVDAQRSRAPAGARFRGASMPYFLRFHDGQGLHAGRVPNFPASHGCVRLPAAAAKYFYEHSSIGTPVRVVH